MSFSPAYVSLAADPATITPVRLWQALPREERVQAILTSLNGEEGPGMRTYFAGLVASGRGGFRIASVKKWSKEELAQRVAREPLTQVHGLLVDLHFPDRAHIQAFFYDDLGIVHVNGRTDEAVAPTVVPREKIAPAADRLIEKFPDDAGLFYLLTIWALDSTLWAGLDRWLTDFTARAPRA